MLPEYYQNIIKLLTKVNFIIFRVLKNRNSLKKRERFVLSSLDFAGFFKNNRESLDLFWNFLFDGSGIAKGEDHDAGLAFGFSLAGTGNSGHLQRGVGICCQDFVNGHFVMLGR